MSEVKRGVPGPETAVEFIPATGAGGILRAVIPGGFLFWSELQGLFAWQDGTRVEYSGGDRQVSSGGRVWCFSGAPGEPAELGLQAAISPLRLN